MPRRKIPADAFQYYVSLGPQASYEAVAKHYQVTKRSVTKVAAREGWQARLEEIQRKAREGATEKAIETLEAMNDRHVKALRFLQGKAIEILKNSSLGSGIDAAKALELAIRQERLIRGEPSERSALTIEDVIKREYARWMVPDDEDGNG
jgi:hypothetical protein